MLRNDLVALLRAEAKTIKGTVALPVELIEVLNGKKHDGEWQGNFKVSVLLQYIADMLEE